ncbi:Protein NETWORKED 2A [Dichanthelium oligosanthes]|uniref:Protein NETWORKED 2A n=1 Tax=Dichanthelium oligosanthes TaxID=888268 RepID=A0A1E5VDS3_9POAL|nr:Protein NETWORKED 2A [Dichanthelium oligosanthes]
MLQRAASNAYSWWWASHIRTTQSKWLETTVGEMEDRVQAMLKLIGADADSFGKKAELYFRSRPELINHVEEMFRSYQALADRFDRISSELHKANHTIATVFPDQVQFSMQEGDGEGLPKVLSGIDLSNFKFPSLEGLSMGSHGGSRGTSPVPKKGAQAHRRVTSNMTKEKAQEEIDKLQKQILALQTEKEFLKTSYESALGKYLDIEKQVAELQDEVCSLQDAFSTGAAIEDNEARALMAAQAIVSCEDTLVSLQDQQKRSTEETKVEFRRANEAIEKLKTFKNECGLPHAQMEGHDHHDTKLSHALPVEDADDSALNEGRLDLQEICQKVKEIIERYPELSVAELADKVDRLVEKVINLELATTSQNAQIDRMRTEIDGLHERLHALEQDKTALVVDSSSLADRLKKVEEMMQEVQQIWKSVQNGTANICKEMTEASHELTEFVETLHAPEPEISDFVDSLRDSKGDASLEDDDSGQTSLSVKKDLSSSLHDTSEIEKHDEISEGPVAQKQLVRKEPEGEEKILLQDYASVLQSYKDTEQKLSEIEKRNQGYHLEAMSELKDLKSANATKDEEIHSLRRMLSSLQKKMSASITESIEKSEETSKISTSPATEDKEIAEIEEYIKQCKVDDSLACSVAEEKFRAEIDRVLGENLDFWLRFSTSYHQIRNFQTSFDKLKTEMNKLTDEQEQGGTYGFAASYQVAKLESAVLEKKFRDLNTDLQVWMEKNVLLKGELENRFSSLCSIQEDISKITTLDKSDEVHFNPFQAAKFQGEVLNMKQEHNKVAKELEAGLDHVRGLQVEVGRVLLKLRENLEISIARSHRAQQNFRNLSTKAGVPLRTFLFGSKPKKPSLFSCMGPGVHKHHGGSKAGSR